MLDLVNEGGMPVAASVRSISRRAGVTEAVLYRYFPNKDAMFREVWERTLSPMVLQKRRLLEDAESEPAEVLRDWIRITYEHFDEDPAAFHYVYLSEGTATWREDPAYREQGDLLRDWIASVIPAEAIAPWTHSRARDYFASLLHSVPRKIRMGDLEGPAVGYAGETLEGAKRLFRL